MCYIRPVTVKGFKLKPGKRYTVTGETVLLPLRRVTYSGQVFHGIDCRSGNPLFTGGHLPRAQIVSVQPED